MKYGTNKSSYNDYESSSFVLIILSALIHDVEFRLRREFPGSEFKEKHEADKNSLIEMIAELSSSNLLANVVVLSEEAESKEHRLCQVPLWRHLKIYFSDRIRRYSINLDNCRLPYATLKKKKNIKLFYTNPAYIDKSLFLIKLKKSGEYIIGLTSDNLDPHLQYMSLDYQILNEDYTEKEGDKYKGKLSSNGKLFKIPDVQKGENIKWLIRVFNGPIQDVVV